MSFNKREVVIVSGVRTPIGTYGGALKGVSPVDLASQCIREAVSRASIEPKMVEHSIFGNVLQTEPRDAYLSRCAAIKGGLSEYSAAMNVNRLCGSGLQAVVSASQLIQLGEARCVVAGGAESMSRVPYALPAMRWGARMGETKALDSVTECLQDPFGHGHMGCTAENLAQKYKITREDQDELALESHRRAANAWDKKFFDEQVTAIEISSRRAVKRISQDNHFRDNISIDELSKLRTVFQQDGTVTASNSSGINDAAAALILMDREVAENQGVKPLARIVGYSYAGVDPRFMGIGPVPAIKSLMQNTGLSIDDMDVIELNEAFAAQVLAVITELNLPREITNTNGSGISLGHPIGATGAIIMIKALYELIRTKGKYGLVSMCIGGGQGSAAIIEAL